MEKKRFLPAALSLIVLSTGIWTGSFVQAEDLTENNTDEITEETGITDDMRAAALDFSVRLFQQAGLSMEEDNLLVSPLSALYALGMTANGADGETREQMEEVFGVSVEEMNEFLCAYKSILPSAEEYSVFLANSIWINEDERFSVEPDFQQTNTDYYDADLFVTPFDSDALTAVNDWVNENTDGMIGEMLSDIQADAVMYLLNAVSFEADWENVYTEGQLDTGTFITEDGDTLEVDMMYSEESVYLEDDTAVGFLKYYADEAYAFVAILPDEEISVSDYMTSLTGEKLLSLLDGVQSVTVNTGMPKFETEFSTDMNRVLSDMGMPDAFDSEKADFSLLGQSENGNIFISKVLQKTYIAVDDQGTKAGASTAVEMMDNVLVVSPGDAKTVYLDRPFVYMIIDCETNTPVFMGTVMNPAL
ncbi:MAG: serpin family protein [Clostridiales bacterium]|nr:serpin family protein [Clostridiales bacterium]